MATGEKSLRVAAVGLGWVTQNRHLPVMTRNPMIDVVGVIDRTPGHAQSVAKRFGDARHADAKTLSDVGWLDDVDAITIGTSPFSHHALVSEALSLGKHVLTEKPFTMSLDESDDLIKRRDDAGRVLCVVHNFQFAHSTSRLLADLASGRLGQMKSLSAVQLGNPRRRLPEWYEELPLGLFYDESPHLLYLLRRLASAPLQLEHSVVHASTTGAVTPARVEAHYSFHDGEALLPATLSCNFESPVSEWYLIVYGTERMAIVDVFRDLYVCLPNDDNHVTKTVLRTSLSASWQHWAGHFRAGWGHLTGRLFYGNETVFDKFARAALNGEEPVGIRAEDARDVQRMQFEVVERSQRVGGPE